MSSTGAFTFYKQWYILIGSDRTKVFKRRVGRLLLSLLLEETYENQHFKVLLENRMEMVTNKGAKNLTINNTFPMVGSQNCYNTTPLVNNRAWRTKPSPTSITLGSHSSFPTTKVIKMCDYLPLYIVHFKLCVSVQFRILCSFQVNGKNLLHLYTVNM